LVTFISSTVSPVGLVKIVEEMPFLRFNFSFVTSDSEVLTASAGRNGGAGGAGGIGGGAGILGEENIPLIT